ncbi:hypothetical protein AMELA_G00134830 [Ameiurus melas]|uniref:Uncharacterized protein n=1 Tax=Ameiurus melas TaxID=219545 RepID=A0A7J6AJY1_AMEME|nr:hypothetical protein AMELA_G00134830 [Ameiurus melas]
MTHASVLVKTTIRKRTCSDLKSVTRVTLRCQGDRNAELWAAAPGNIFGLRTVRSNIQQPSWSAEGEGESVAHAQKAVVEESK